MITKISTQTYTASVAVACTRALPMGAIAGRTRDGITVAARAGTSAWSSPD